MVCVNVTDNTVKSSPGKKFHSIIATRINVFYPDQRRPIVRC